MNPAADLNAAGVHQIIAARAAETPNATAVVYGRERISYAELEQSAEALAQHMRALGIPAGALVGICSHRRIELVVAIVATLKAGCAYLPLDPTYPTLRLAAMMQGVDMAVLLTTSSIASTLPDHPARVVFVDRELPKLAPAQVHPSAVSADDLCYAIYTSGSTGTAKVAGVRHRGWRNLVCWFADEFAIHAGDRVLVISSFSFDITQRAIVMPLVVGAELHLYDSPHYDPARIATLIEREQITLLNCAPSTFYPLVEHSDAARHTQLRSLREVFLGGEPISASRLLPWAKHAQTELVNVYGVAECSDVSSFHRLSDYDRYVSRSVPVGRPIHNTRIYLLNEALEPVNAGETGEICIAGEGVGAGYLNDPALTREKFVEDVRSERSGGTLYRTGDLARLDADGNLEFVGRVDHQVKLRGYRIHLGDIETTLRQHPEVRELVAIKEVDPLGDERLAGYFVPAAWPPSDELSDRVRDYARTQLPDYMVPAEFVVLEQLPLNPNGKVDRGALSQLARKASSPSRAAPIALGPSADGATETREMRVTALFAEALAVQDVDIDIDEDFFDIGGDSLKAVQVVAGISSQFGVSLSMDEFFLARSVRAVCARLPAETAR